MANLFNTFESVAREWGASNIIWSAEHSTALFSELTGFNIALNAVQSGSRASGASCATAGSVITLLGDMQHDMVVF